MNIGDKVEVSTDTTWSGENTLHVGEVVEITDSVFEHEGNTKNVRVRFDNGVEQVFWPGEYVECQE